MLNLAYTITVELKEALYGVEDLRHFILLTPLSPKTELKLKWEALVNRIYDVLSIADIAVTKSDIVKVLSQPNKTHAGTVERSITNCRQALHYLWESWLANPKSITPTTLMALTELAFAGSSFRRLTREIENKDRDLQKLFDYLQGQNENPVIVAAIAQAQITTLITGNHEGHYLGRLLAYLFLYKYGFDCRGMLVLNDSGGHRQAREVVATIKAAVASGNLTSWLTYFATSLIRTLTKTKENITSSQIYLEIPAAFWNLNDRQKTVLKLLEEPGKTITNRQVQKLFRMSQITASRDLARLTSLGLVFAHGKGRSVYYTKI